MDRRQRKSRSAIFNAFIELLSEKSAEKITVEEIIKRADVGRATFYAHFETKDFLLRELSRELFCHIFDGVNNSKGHKHIFECDAPEDIYLHLFLHLKNNDNHILDLLSSKNSSVFFEYFKNELKGLAEQNFSDSVLPKDLAIKQTVYSFIATVEWWSENNFSESAEKVNEYFKTVNGYYRK